MRIGVVFILVQLVYLEGILSLDNAAVLGAMVSRLPRDDPIPWPRLLGFLRKPARRVLGNQRRAALKVGLLGAYLGRAIMLFFAAAVIHNRWLLLAGGLYLIKLAASQLGAAQPASSEMIIPGVSSPAVGRTPRVPSFWGIVLAVELADLAFSLDNVVAAVALSRELWIVLTGVALGVLTMRFAAGLFGTLLERYPLLETAAYLLVLIIGGVLIMEEFGHVFISDTEKFAVSFGTLAVSLIYGQSPFLQRLGRHLRWLKRVLSTVNLIFNYLLMPVSWVAALCLILVRAVGFLFAIRRRSVEITAGVPRSGTRSSSKHGRS